MESDKNYNHTSAILERLEDLQLKDGFPDLTIICQDGSIDSYRLLLGACSEMIRGCLEPAAGSISDDNTCLILPNLTLAEIKAFHTAVLCYRDTPTNHDLDAVLKVLATIGVNIGPYVDVSLADDENLDVEDIPTICFLNVDQKIDIPDSVIKNEITWIIPSSLDVFPVDKDHKTLKSICFADNNDRLQEDFVDCVSPDPTNSSSHIKTYDDTPVKYTCPFCGKEFRNVSPYEKHLLDHQDPMGFKNMQSKSKTASSSLECSHCPKQFTTVKQLKDHQKTHSASNQFSCDKCDKKFSLRSTLTNHLKSHDESSRVRRFVCDLCKKVFSHPSNLKRHIRQVHSENDDDARTHSCFMCDKRFKDPSTLKSHLAGHNQVREFQCTLCSKSYVKKSQLNTHLLSHTGEKPFVCNLCHRSFKTAGHLKSHKINRHVGVKLTKSHLCSECGQGFIKEYDLRVHLRRHRGERPFCCGECGKSFHGERHYVEHQRTHTGEKPFQCETCKKRFSTSAGLRQHFKSYANCRLQATEGAYSKCPQKRSEWSRLNGAIQIPEFIIPSGSSLHNLDGFTVEELKEPEETVVYLTSDTDLSLVAGGIIETDMEGQVNIQTLPLQMDPEGNGEVVNLVEMSENL